MSASDFHIFEDGIEQKIESLRLEPEAAISARDNFGVHWEHSQTLRGKWNHHDIDPQVLELRGTLSFYRITYVPPKAEQGRCHHIRVTVDRPHAAVFAREQYCYIEHPLTDPLNGTKFGQQLQTDLDSDRRAKIPLSLQAGFLYTDTQKARVGVVLEFPWKQLKHGWIGAEFQATIGVLGIAYNKDGTLAARFSDFACCAPESPMWLMSGANPLLDPDLGNPFPPDYERHAPDLLPNRYEAQFDLPAGGAYDLRVVLSDGDKFGRANMPLVIDSWDGKQLVISSVVLCKRFRDAGAAAQEAAAVNLAPQYVPLVSKGVQVTPAADTNFKRGEHFIAYFEVYEPLLSQQPAPRVQAQMRIVDAKTGAVKQDFGLMDAAPYQRPGSTMIPIGDELPVSQLPKGAYRLEVRATDSAGRSTPWRTATFTLE